MNFRLHQSKTAFSIIYWKSSSHFWWGSQFRLDFMILLIALKDGRKVDLPMNHVNVTVSLPSGLWSENQNQWLPVTDFIYFYLMPHIIFESLIHLFFGSFSCALIFLVIVLFSWSLLIFIDLAHINHIDIFFFSSLLLLFKLHLHFYLTPHLAPCLN